MSDLKRYDCAGGGIGSYCQGCYHMEPNDLGDYVRYEDFERELTRVRVERDAANDEIERLQERVLVLSSNWPADHEQPD